MASLAPWRHWRRQSPRPGEEALLARVRNLEPSAWRLLFDQAYPVLSTYAMLRLGSAAEASAAIRDGMLGAVEALPSSRSNDPLRIVLLGFVADRVAVLSRLQMVPDPGVATALPPEGRRARYAFWALPSCEQDLLALLVAGATQAQAASVIRWDPAVAARSIASACSLLAPGRPLVQVLERLRASFPDRPWEPRIEDQQALRTAVVAARSRRRRRRRLGSAAAAAVAAAILVVSLTGGMLPRSLRTVAHSAGLPVRSPLVSDAERAVDGLNDAMRRGDPPSVDMAVRTLTSAVDALAPAELRQVRSDVELDLLRARQFLDERRASVNRP